MTVDDLIKALRDLKREDPQAGGRVVYAGDTNLIRVDEVRKNPFYPTIILTNVLEEG